MSMSDYLEQKVIEETLRGLNFAVPDGTHVALLTSNPADGTIVECGATDTPTGFIGYQRVDAKGGGSQSAAWTAYDAGSSRNALAITFAANGNSVNSVTIRGIGIYDQATSGNLLYWAALTTPKTLAPGDVLSFAINAITVTLD